MQRLRSNPVTEATAMRVVMEHEQSQGRQVKASCRMANDPRAVDQSLPRIARVATFPATWPVRPQEKKAPRGGLLGEPVVS